MKQHGRSRGAEADVQEMIAKGAGRGPERSLMQPTEATRQLRTTSSGCKVRRPMVSAAVPFRTFMKVSVDQLWPDLLPHSGERSIAINAAGLKGE